MEVSGQIVDVVNRKIYGGLIRLSNGRIAEIPEKDGTGCNYIY